MAKQVAEATNKEIYPIWNKKGELEPGAKIEGFYIAKETFTTKFGEAESFIIEKEGGEKVAVFGQTDVRNKMSEIPEGCYVWIEYVGLTETKNGARKTYTIEYDPEVTIEVK